jgi:type I restriction-modification system DNA methylase subunit
MHSAAPQALELLAIRNTNLFSNHFLEARLHGDPVWTSLRERSEQVFERVREIHDAAARLKLFSSTNEALAEDRYIVPVLEALGWHTLPQSSLRLGGKRRVPDHSLFMTPEAQQEGAAALASTSPDIDRFARALTTLVEAKSWGRALDGRGSALADADPTAQTVNYLDALHRHDVGVEWAIVTNGSTWRLLYVNADSRISNHYEVDLFTIVETGDIERFALYFLPFFGPDGFVAPVGSNRTRLQLAIDRSESYAAGVRDRIKELVYTQVVGRLGDGFLRAWHRERSSRELDSSPTPDLLERIYDGCLTYLYRMLFVLYAESRGLLPVGERGYGRQSMDNLRQRVRDAVMNDEPVSARTRDFARDLEDLRRLIHEGEPAFNLPQYNGALFRRTDKDFPDAFEVTDDGLLMVIFLLTIDTTWNEQAGHWSGHGFFDYSSLTVRHLGDIYEGLLEFRLSVAETPLVSSRKDGKDVWRAATDDEVAAHEGHTLNPVAAVQRAARPGGTVGYVPAGGVYVTNDRGERKSGGSYYTPHDIVEYVVSETVVPMLEERLERATRLFDSWATLLRRAATDDEVSLIPAGAEILADQAFETIFGLSVCDPAMGSGHFLVHTVNVVADRIAASIAAYNSERRADDEAHPGDPITPRFNRMRREIIDGMRRQGLSMRPGDEANLRDANLIRRLVLKRCIYGVDINRRAVELAKLSLWLHSFVIGAPLSFLDHHLKHGNSLVGARWSDVLTGIQGELPLFAPDTSGIRRATDAFVQMNARVDATFDQVALSKTQSAEADSMLEPFRELLDLWTARALDRDVTSPAKSRFHHLLTGGSYRVAAGWGMQFLLDDAVTFEEGRALARAEHAFHWELEFPEVFFEQGEIAAAAGFDAVIGNPPYVRQESVSNLKPYFADRHRDVYSGVADLYVYFYHIAIELLRPGGQTSYIVTNKWLRAGYGEGLRRYFARNAEIKRIVDFGHAPIFAEADVFPCIVLLRRPVTDARPETETEICLFPREQYGKVGIPAFVRATSYRIASDRFGAEPWSTEPPEVEALMEKIRRAGMPMRAFLGHGAYYGIKTGLNEAFIVDQPSRQQLISVDAAAETLLTPILRGQDIKRWVPDYAGLSMIAIPSSSDRAWPWSEAEDAEAVFREAYPSVHGHLKRFEPQLRRRQDKGRYWWELRPCSYYDIFDGPKLIHTDITWRPQFAFSSDRVLMLNTAYVWPTDDLYVLGILNSPMMWAYMWRNALHGKDEALRLIYSFIEDIPIVAVPEAGRELITASVEHLLERARQERSITTQVLEWLRIEFGIIDQGAKLVGLLTSTGDAFAAEVRKRRPRTADRLTPAAVSELLAAHREHAPTLRQIAAEKERLEARISDLVNEAYGLTVEEIDLMWRTAPPRMPGRGPERAARGLS